MLKSLRLITVLLLAAALLLPQAALAAASPEDSAQLLWVRVLGTGWADMPSEMTAAPDGTLLLTSGKALLRLDAATGDTLCRGELRSGARYGLTAPVEAGGLVFAAQDGGLVEAFDAQSLEPVWAYTAPLGGQALCPVTLAGEYLLTGFWNGETADGEYVCLDAATGAERWRLAHTGGFYRAGALAHGDAVWFLSDDGAAGTGGECLLRRVRLSDGETLLSLSAPGDGRCTPALYNDDVYFTTKAGHICRAAIDGSLETGVLTGESSSTPAIWDGYAYVGVSDGTLARVATETLKTVDSVSLGGYPQCDPLLYAAADGQAVLCLSCNALPGGLWAVVCGAEPDSMSAARIFSAEGYESYCLSTPVAGANGDVFYRNDSGAVFALAALDVPGAAGEAASERPLPQPAADLSAPANLGMFAAIAAGAAAAACLAGGLFTRKKRARAWLLIGAALLTAGCVAAMALDSSGHAGGDTATVTVSVDCADILAHPDTLPPGKASLLPADGVLLPPTRVELPAGSSAFDALKAAALGAGLHMEFSASPYGGKYIEGIGNIYQLDCGPTSGWLYYVDGVSATVGCSECTLHGGEALVFSYSCDFAGEGW